MAERGRTVPRFDHWLTLLCEAGFFKRDVGRIARRVDLDLVQVEVAGPGQRQPHVPRRLGLQGHRQRLVVRLPQEGRAVVLIGLFELLAVRRQQHADAAGPRGESAVAAVEQQQAVQRLHRPQVDLPPRVLFVFGVEAPLAVLEAVDRPRGVFLRLHAQRDLGRARQPQLQLPQPVRFQLLRTERRLSGGCQGQQRWECQRGSPDDGQPGPCEVRSHKACSVEEVAAANRPRLIVLRTAPTMKQR